MSAPLSYASHALNLEKNQSMPNQARPKSSKPKKDASAAAAPESTTPQAAADKPATSPVAAADKKPATPAKPAAASKPAAVATKAPAAAKKSEDAAASPEASPVASPAAGERERAPPQPRTYYTGFAMVKAVLSGDSLVLAGSSNGGVETPEKVITLTGVLAPKFGRGKNQVDEPYAWEAREYLRKHVIGKQVQFAVQHTHDASGRDYGTVTLAGVDIATQMLKAGWVTVKPAPAGKDGKMHPEKEALLAIQAEAVNRNLGVHKKGADSKQHLRTIDWTPDAAALFAANKNTPLAGVVDQVRDGCTLRVELVHPNAPLKHTMITLVLAGVLCPRTPLPLSVLRQQHERKEKEDASYKGKAPTKEEKADPFAMEAQAYTETRLLNRDVQVYLQGVDKSGNLFGTAAFAKGNITLKLLSEGLGKFVPWSAALTPDADKMKQAEQQAKSQKLRMWKNYQEGDASSSAASGSAAGGASGSVPAEFQGKVLSVASSDSLVVEDTSNGSEVRIWLSSVRAPRLATRGGKGDSKDEPYAQEAKEFLRSKLIGNKVRVVPEYVRASAADDKRDARLFATVFQNKLNINEALISSGFAEALQHRMDEERSQFYDSYIQAETKAKEAQKGKHDPKEHVVKRVTDLTDRVRPRRKPAAPVKKAAPADGAEADAEDDGAEKKEAEAAKPAAPSKAEEAALAKSKQLSAQAKQYMTLLKGEVNAVVEFVFSASRFKLLVPKEHVMISFSIQGIRTPAPKGADGKADPLSEEILQYVRSRVQQHSVKIEVETMDKADNFLGSMFHNRTNLAVDLLERGYASIFGFSAAKSPYAKQLYAAERQAKDARKGIWLNYVEPTPEEKAAMGGHHDDDGADSKDNGPSERVARITEIVDVGNFYVQFIGDKNAEAVEKALAAVAAQPDSDEPFNAPASANGRSFVAAGQFSDDSWHRVRCEGQDGNGDWKVNFIDFGNDDLLVPDRLRTLPAEAQKIPPLAVRAALAGLEAPRAVEYQEGSALAFSDMAYGVDMRATVEFSDKFGVKHLTLSHESHPISVNRQLLKDGWAKVASRPDRRIARIMGELQDEQTYAKRNHFNVFEYGDVSDEEEGAEKIHGPDPKARNTKPLVKGLASGPAK